MIITYGLDCSKILIWCGSWEKGSAGLSAGAEGSLARRLCSVDVDKMMHVLDPVARTLLELDFDVNPRNRLSLTPLHRLTILSQCDQMDGFTKFLDAFDAFGNTSLHYAVMLRNERAVKTLLLLGADPNLRQQPNPEEEAVVTRGFAPLHLACESYFLPILQLLLEDKALDCNSYSTSGLTPLHVACRCFFFEAVSVLLSTGKVDVNTVTSTGLNALHLIALNASANTNDTTTDDFARPGFPGSSNEHANLLLSKKCEANAVDANGCSPLHTAAAKGVTSLVNTLVTSKKVSVNLSLADNLGNTPLHYAAKTGVLECASPQVVIVLLKHGANPTLANNSGETPLDIIRGLLKSRLWTESEELALNVAEGHLQVKEKQFKESQAATAELLAETAL